MSRSTALIAVIVFICALLLGCSGEGDNPLQPGPGAPDQEVRSPRDSQVAQTHLWGLYTVTIDPESREVESMPLRTAMFTANVVEFMNSNPLSMSFGINAIIPGAGFMDVDIDVGLTHPFPGLPQYNGYDVRGIFMGNGSVPMKYNPDLIYSSVENDQSMFADEVDGYGGPDGYTRWFNIDEFNLGGPPLFQYTQGKLATPGYDGTATVNPYKYFADGLSPTENLWDWLMDHSDQNGQFSSGATNERNYYLRFPDTIGIQYLYAIIANWEGDLEEHHPSNAPEAVAVDVIDNSDLWFVDPGYNGGSINLDISVFDWHSELSAGVMENYDIIIDSTVTGFPYIADDTDMTPVGGDAIYSTYHVEVAADALSKLDDNECWVIIEYPDLDYSNEFGAPNDAMDSPLAAFFRYDLDVSPNPPCDFTLDHMNPDTADIGDDLTGVEIIGEDLQDGAPLACFLTNGTVDVTGTNVTFVDAQLVTADFDFATAGAESGSYDLVFTNGDNCEDTLPDAMLLTSAEWPVLIDGDESYYMSRYVEDSNGIFHVFAGYEVVNGTPGEWQLKWFFSEDFGQTWTSGGDIYETTGAGFTSTIGTTACGVDDSGGVYVAYAERHSSSWQARAIKVAYLDTATYNDPDNWDPSDWQTKDGVDMDREPSGIYLAVSPQGSMLIYAMRYTTSTVFFNYADSFTALDASTSSILNSTYGVENMSFQHVYLSLNNASVYNPSTDTFFVVQAGNFDHTSPYGGNTASGGYILEYDPDASGYKWSMETYFDHPYTLAGDTIRINYGDLAIDSGDNLHWVHQYRHPTTAYPYNLNNMQNKFIYGTNETGSWLYTDPISDNYVFPDPPDNGPNNQILYEARALNLVADSNDDVILTWMRSRTYADLMGGTRSGGTWADTPVELNPTDLDVWLPAGEAWGTKSALTFTTYDYQTGNRGALYFTMTDGTQ